VTSGPIQAVTLPKGRRIGNLVSQKFGHAVL